MFSSGSGDPVRARAASVPVKENRDFRTARFVSYWEGYAPRCDDRLDGFATIGFGHLLRFSPCTAEDRELWWSKRKALAQLDKDLRDAAGDVRRLVRVPLSADQRSALISFTFNVGQTALRDSTLRRLLNGGNYRAAADQLLRWVHGPGAVELPGLHRRRAAERQLFLGRS